MLIEYVFRNGFYITCTVKELKDRLTTHACNYSTLQELVDDLCPITNKNN